MGGILGFGAKTLVPSAPEASQAAWDSARSAYFSGLVHQLEAMLRSERRSTSAFARSRSAQTATIWAAPCSCNKVDTCDSSYLGRVSQ